MLHDPRLQLSVRVRVSVPSAGYQADFQHAGPPRRFSAWAAHPEDLNEEIERALEVLAEKIVEPEEK